MKRIFLTLIVAACLPAALQGFAGGDGTAANPYQISTREQLEAVSSFSPTHYILINDIDLSGTTYAQNLIFNFAGTFDGRGFEIKSLTIAGGSNSNIGLFGAIDYSGTVSNLGIVDCTISGGNYVGGLCGVNFGTIESSYVSGTVAGDNHTGGLSGVNHGVIISCHASASVSGNYSVGGLCGFMDHTITASYATGNVTGGANVGGLCGFSQYSTVTTSTITNSYATGAVSGSGNVGGLCGWNYSCTITSSFWDMDTSGQTTSAGGTGKTTVQMQTQSTFTDAGWDFANTWIMPNNDYPQLLWQIGEGTPENPYKIRDFQQLQDVNNDLTAHYILMSDIDLSGVVYANAVIAQDKNSAFTGTFDGNGRTISNLKITATDKNYVGLFGYIGLSGVVKNTKLVGCDISGVGIVGGIAGLNDGAMNFCSVSGVLTGSNTIGGFVGSNTTNGIITNSYAECNIVCSGTYSAGFAAINNGIISNSYSDGYVGGYNTVGGFVGHNNYGKIRNCYSISVVEGTNNYSGGFAARNDGTIAHCYSAGEVIGKLFCGGFAGYSVGIIEGCFWDIYESWQTNSTGGAEGKTTAEMKTQATFTDAGWDFQGSPQTGLNDEWQMGASGYPELYMLSAAFAPTVLVGSGTIADPYQISSVQQLAAVNQQPNAHYLLTQGLILSGSTFNNAMVYVFGGSFDGGGNTVSGLTISGISGDEGLFGLLAAGSEVKNLTISSPDIIGGSNAGALCGSNYGTITNCSTIGDIAIDGSDNVGGLAGSSYGIINNCSVDGALGAVGISGSISTGGLVGFNQGHINGNSFAKTNVRCNTILGEAIGGLVGTSSGYIHSSYAEGNISLYEVGGLIGSNSGTVYQSWANTTVEGFSSVGGLAGYSSGAVLRSYSQGNINATELVGGLVGYNGGKIENCYSTANVTGKDTLGGLVGYSDGFIKYCYANGAVIGDENKTGGLAADNDGTIQSCFWDIQTSGQSSSAGGEGKTTAEMNDFYTFSMAGWDMDNIWNIAGYPSHKGVSKFADLSANGVMDIEDFIILADNWLYDEAGWTAGDLNGDGKVDLLDFVIFKKEWNADAAM